MTYDEIADISSHQDDSLAFMTQLARYAQGVMIKLTEGSENGDAYVNPKAGNQVTNGLTVFQSVGAYHYFKANSGKFGTVDPVNEAKWFVKNLTALGLDQSTYCALDVEDNALMKEVTLDINLFLQYMMSQGYTHLSVYASASWFTSGRIRQKDLFNNVPIWVAAYGGSQPGVPDAGAWQYTNNGHQLGVDFSYDFAGILH
ncbi:GH25 family lysozyme [Secundilactobacillus collinoides]|uniref:Glycoside hydrolase family 25 n=1 Tax=Secundilactobacillus collinoides DSM 20515 = JCM 1123 TaxID=1423733 RepID=A0A0R2BDR7_SECCO|nr:GH25 family lysozyme [Secundilactobacillus collinoides]KRM75892.1 glycoside hydrolase family 25 [Secundilactobacillus collinoides DSM 20515 = JCM 1123]